MADKINDGGPVHPCTLLSRDGYPYGTSRGMSVREYYAGQMIPRAFEFALNSPCPEASPCPMAARLCLEMADALIAAEAAEAAEASS